jgi:hypothetical protein
LKRNKNNIDFLPFDFQKYILGKIKSEGIHFRISRPRKSKIGDYKYNYLKKSHSISVNINLSEIQFLVTFIHELAHKKCFDLFVGKVFSHGEEWKNIFVELLIEARNELILSPEWDDVLMSNVKRPKATFTRYDEINENCVLVLNLAVESKFELRNGRRFQLVKKIRTRYLCTDLNNGQLYSVSGRTPIERLIEM